MKGMRDVPKEDKPAFGKMVNDLRFYIEDAVSASEKQLKDKEIQEKLMSEEGLRTTPNKLIHIGSPLPLDANEFLGQLHELMRVAYDGQEEQIRQLVAEAVPTYHPETPAGVN